MNNEERVDDNKKKNHGLEYLTSLDYHSTIICTKNSMFFFQFVIHRKKCFLENNSKKYITYLIFLAVLRSGPTTLQQ